MLSQVFKLKCRKYRQLLPSDRSRRTKLRNTGSSPLRYLCFSTLHTAEIVAYPDSKKVGAMTAPSMEAALRGGDWVRFLAFEGGSVGYYDGEDVS